MNMNRLPATASPKTAVLLATLGLMLTFSTGCQQNLVYQRPISELNQKAQSLMQAGDYEGAVARLESAHDLQPEEPNTTYNLAVAYQMKGDYEKAIAIFNQLLEHPGPDGTPMSAPEVHKTLGITYEAKADKLEAEAKAMEEAPKPDAAKAQQVAQESNLAMQEALMHYQKALPGLKNPQPIQAQIQAIETKLKKGKADVQP